MDFNFPFIYIFILFIICVKSLEFWFYGAFVLKNIINVFSNFFLNILTFKFFQCHIFLNVSQGTNNKKPKN